jgi:hypothetical protein
MLEAIAGRPIVSIDKVVRLFGRTPASFIVEVDCTNRGTALQDFEVFF